MASIRGFTSIGDPENRPPNSRILLCSVNPELALNPIPRHPVVRRRPLGGFRLPFRGFYSRQEVPYFGKYSDTLNPKL